jgi:hypothetical protein
VPSHLWTAREFWSSYLYNTVENCDWIT